MPVVEARVRVPVPPELAFAVSQTTGEIRYRWDPFVRSQRLADGARRPAKGVRTITRSRHGLRMVSEYVSYAPPTHVGIRRCAARCRAAAAGCQGRELVGALREELETRCR